MIALKDNLGSEFVERIRGFFSENGPLSKAKNFEFRPEQQEMAARVAQALEEEQHLIVEAGTGVGKSLGYLVPSVLFALEPARAKIILTALHQGCLKLDRQHFFQDRNVFVQQLFLKIDGVR